jgi:probable HAF family extracellular repeat protein
MSSGKRSLRLVCAAVLTIGSLASAQSYKVIELGSLGGELSQAFGINDNGQVVGASTLRDSSSIPHAFLWTDGKGMQDLGTLGGSFSEATAINNRGWVVGGATLADGSGHAFLWTPSSGMQDLGKLVGGMNSGAAAINRSGQVVGSAITASGDSHAFLWTQSGGMQDLGTLGGASSFATGITDDGAVVGYSYTLPSDGNSHIFFWTAAGGMKDFGKRGGPNTVPSAINNHLWIVGTLGPTPGSGGEAFVRIPHVGEQDLGVVAAVAININNTVVGYTTPDANGDRAFLWTHAGGMQDLGMMIPPTRGRLSSTQSASTPGA